MTAASLALVILAAWKRLMATICPVLTLRALCTLPKPPRPINLPNRWRPETKDSSLNHSISFRPSSPSGTNEEKGTQHTLWTARTYWPAMRPSPLSSREVVEEEAPEKEALRPRSLLPPLFRPSSPSPSSSSSSPFSSSSSPFPAASISFSISFNAFIPSSWLDEPILLCYGDTEKRNSSSERRRGSWVLLSEPKNRARQLVISGVGFEKRVLAASARWLCRSRV